jgi:hypothetical protein
MTFFCGFDMDAAINIVQFLRRKISQISGSWWPYSTQAVFYNQFNTTTHNSILIKYQYGKKVCKNAYCK